ncbi:hypothetical protein GWK18_10460 [Kocuria sp. JC486]|uniref:Uncharacterized protein n=1 Tax=Kocuria soli TaxID=2485125 RepID=A0A3N3ZTV8_9MICC|nr:MULTISPECIES: hypothetical protein [Kocuria]NHU85998.1 hypothetical protein [Kocuria sp. JC486]ROZ65748.1 hypothetical protein EDL96_01360 [Kocuria soli]
MSSVGTLVRAENKALFHHLDRQLGGPAVKVALLAAVVIAGLVLNGLVAVVLGQILDGARETLTQAGASSETTTRTLRQATAVLPYALALGPAAAVLLLHLVMPPGSPLLLHARMVGTSRWTCGSARYLGQLIWGLVLGTSMLAGGAWALSTSLSERPIRAMIGVILLGAVVAASSTTVLTAAQSFLHPVLRSYESARAVGLLTVCTGIALVFSDILRGASGGPSALGSLSRAWGGLLPDSLAAHGLLLLMLLTAIILGLAAARSDASGGALSVHGRARTLPTTRWPTLDLVTRELAQVLRDPVVRVAMITSVVLAGLLAAGVHTVGLHPGIAVMVIVLISAMGAETVHGRTRETAWILRLAGLSPLSIALLRTLPYLGLQLSVLVLFLAPVALPFGGPLAWAEALSLFALTFTVALLAGTLVPYDRQAPTAVAVTSVLTLSLEILALGLITWAFSLQGWTLILVDLALAAALFTVAVRFMTRSVSTCLG